MSRWIISNMVPSMNNFVPFQTNYVLPKLFTKTYAVCFMSIKAKSEIWQSKQTSDLRSSRLKLSMHIQMYVCDEFEPAAA